MSSFEKPRKLELIFKKKQNETNSSHSNNVADIWSFASSN